MAKKGKRKDMDPLFDVKDSTEKKEEKVSRFSLDKSIDNLVGALCDPIIIHGGSWGTPDMIPEWLRNQITMDRMIELMVASKEGRDPMGTDSEALAYMIPASMEAPMGHDWTQIYLYLATVVIDREKSKVVPDDIRVNEINRNQQDDLRRLKRWIYETKLKHRAGRRQEIKKEIKEDKEREKEEAESKAQADQPTLFEFE